MLNSLLGGGASKRGASIKGPYELPILIASVVVFGAIAVGVLYAVVAGIIKAVAPKPGLSDADMIRGTYANPIPAQSMGNNTVPPVKSELTKEIETAKVEVDMAACTDCQARQPDFFQFTRSPAYWAEHTAKCGPIRNQCRKVGFDYRLWSELPGTTTK